MTELKNWHQINKNHESLHTFNTFQLKPNEKLIFNKDELRVTFSGRCNNLVLMLFITSSHSVSSFMTSKQVTFTGMSRTYVEIGV